MAAADTSELTSLQEEETGKKLQAEWAALGSPVMRTKLCCCYVMITVLFVAVVGLSVALAVTKPKQDILSANHAACPSNWIGFGNKCFYFSEDRRNWTHSQASCKELGAELARFENQEELSFLRRYKGFSDHWIGLHRESLQQPWKWPDNTDYNNMEIVNGEGTCAYLSTDRISSSKATIPRRWICSKPSSFIQCPKPPTTS